MWARLKISIRDSWPSGLNLRLEGSCEVEEELNDAYMLYTLVGGHLKP